MTNTDTLRVIRGTSTAPYLFRVIGADFPQKDAKIAHFAYRMATDSFQCQILRVTRDGDPIGAHVDAIDTELRSLTADDALRIAATAFSDYR